MELKTIGDVWAVYRKAGLTEPHVSAINFFEDAEILQKLLNRITELEKQQTELLKTLTEIKKGDGLFDMDPLHHAGNCIVNMKSLARYAINKITEDK